MNFITLSNYSDVRDGVTYSVVLRGAVVPDSEQWKFMVDISYNYEGIETQTKLPFKIFEKLRLFIIDNDNVPEDITISQLGDNSIDMKYRKSNFHLTADLVEILRESKFMAKFEKCLRKCNFPYNGIHAENILCWLDPELEDQDDFNEVVWFPIGDFQMKNSDVYSLSIRALTNDTSDRWNVKITISASDRSLHRQSGEMNMSVVDFIALRDYLLTYKKFPYYNLLFPSGKAAEIVRVKQDNLVIGIELKMKDSSFILPLDFIKIIQNGAFIPKIRSTLRKLNHEMEPQPNLRYWIYNGKVIIDDSVSRFPECFNV